MVSTLIDQHPDRFAVVEIHVQFDGFETPWGEDRINVYYGGWCGSGIPIIMFDGYWFWDPPDYEYGLEERLDEPTDVTIDVTAAEAGDREWDFTGQVCIESGGTNRTMRIYAVQTLDRFPAQPDYSRNTLRQALPTRDVNLAAGECTDVDFTFVFDDESWQSREDIKVVLWAQEPSDTGPAIVFQAAQVGWPFPQGSQPLEPEFPRGFELALPLYDGLHSAWIQDASTAGVASSSADQILTTYRALCGDISGLFPVDDPPTANSPYPTIRFDDHAVPIFAAGSGVQDVLLCDYEGFGRDPNIKWGVPDEGGPVETPSCSGMVRPAGPTGIDSDGAMVLFDVAHGVEYDFWQATTISSGECQSDGAGLPGSSVPQAGQVDFFDVGGPGANAAGVWGARASATPLLAGAVLPEDVIDGEIGHALAVAVPGVRNLNADPDLPLRSDVVYPASFTQTRRYSTDPHALAAGQRLRLRSNIVASDGDTVNEAELAPITRMVVAALRNHGAYVVDSANGLALFAEDIHTAVLDLEEDAVNALIGEPAGTPLPGGKTKWQVVMEALDRDLATIPFAYGSCDGASSTVTVANFDVVEPATPPPAQLPAPRRPGGRRMIAQP